MQLAAYWKSIYMQLAVTIPINEGKPDTRLISWLITWTGAEQPMKMEPELTIKLTALTLGLNQPIMAEHH